MIAAKFKVFKEYKRINVNIEIATMTPEEKADEIICRCNVDFPNKQFTFLDVSLALYELETAKEHLMKAAKAMETRLVK